MAARRICVEFLPPKELYRPSVMRLLVPRGIAPMLALHGPDDDADGDGLAALQHYAAQGIAACAWPLLDDRDGYWPGVANAARFADRVRSLLARADRDGIRLPSLAVDLEPPIDAVLRASRGAPLATALGFARNALVPDRDGFAAAERTYAALQHELVQRSITSVAIAYPFVTADFTRPTGRGLSRLVDAPLRVGWDRVTVLAFGSMLSGLSRGALSIADARWYAHRALGQLARAVGPRAGAFVGIVGKGKLGDEPAYDHPDELARDVAALRAAGVDDLSLFCLEGVLASSRPETWLDALFAAPQQPERTVRGELLHRSITALACALDRGRGE